MNRRRSWDERDAGSNASAVAAAANDHSRDVTFTLSTSVVIQWGQEHEERSGEVCSGPGKRDLVIVTLWMLAQMCTRWQMCWLQHQELTHLWSRDDTCIGVNIITHLWSRDNTCDGHSPLITWWHLYWRQHHHSPVITWWHLCWLQHQELNHLRGVLLQSEDHRTCFRLHVLQGMWKFKLYS